MPTKKLLGAAAFSAALAAGGVAGAIFGTPTLLSAQEAADESTEVAPDEREGRPFAGHKGASLDAAAEALGVTAEQLRAELAAGRSIADVAAEKGVDKQTVIDALVAAANARIDELQTELPERMAALVERDGPAGPHGHHGRGGPGPDGGFGRMGLFNAFDDAATALGISRQELRAELEGGASIAAIAAERGTSLGEVKAAMVADATARIDQAVADGRIDEAKATAIKGELSAKVAEVVEREGLPARSGRRA